MRVQPARHDPVQEMRRVLPRRLHRVGRALPHVPHTLTPPRARRPARSNRPRTLSFDVIVKWIMECEVSRSGAICLKNLLWV